MDNKVNNIANLLDGIDTSSFVFRKKPVVNNVLARLGFGSHREYFDNEDRLKLGAERNRRVGEFKVMSLSELKKDLSIILTFIHEDGGRIDKKYSKKFKLEQKNLRDFELNNFNKVLRR